ncbi:lipid II flippase MurJ, partial [Burkholderia cenocepacia]|uniref:lipid II flippase MurJ n=1 Tax=Burkholderia cenocepacia TaxID=95486 RepID=UPI003C12FB5D
MATKSSEWQVRLNARRAGRRRRPRFSVSAGGRVAQRPYNKRPMNLFRALLTVSGFTLLSRVTGLARETLIARAFGASQYTDAFYVAFRIPNLLRR